MVKGAGLGSVDARAIGPAHEQHAAGVVDVLVGSDAVTSPYTPLHPLTSSYIPLHPLQVGSDAEAAEAARQVLGCCQGPLPSHLLTYFVPSRPLRCSAIFRARCRRRPTAVASRARTSAYCAVLCPRTVGAAMRCVPWWRPSLTLARGSSCDAAGHLVRPNPNPNPILSPNPSPSPNPDPNPDPDPNPNPNQA